MKIIPTYVHGVIDYIYAAAFLLMPNLLGFTEVAPAAMLSRVLGLLILGQAVSTKYELGFLNVITMRTHLVMDYGLGVLMVAAPWIFGFSSAPKSVWLPFVVLGIAEESATAMTQLFPRSANGQVRVSA